MLSIFYLKRIKKSFYFNWLYKRLHFFFFSAFIKKILSNQVKIKFFFLFFLFFSEGISRNRAFNLSDLKQVLGGLTTFGHIATEENLMHYIRRAASEEVDFPLRLSIERDFFYNNGSFEWSLGRILAVKKHIIHCRIKSSVSQHALLAPCHVDNQVDSSLESTSFTPYNNSRQELEAFVDCVARYVAAQRNKHESEVLCVPEYKRDNNTGSPVSLQDMDEEDNLFAQAQIFAQELCAHDTLQFFKFDIEDSGIIAFVKRSTCGLDHVSCSGIWDVWDSRIVVKRKSNVRCAKKKYRVKQRSAEKVKAFLRDCPLSTRKRRARSCDNDIPSKKTHVASGSTP